MKAITPLKMKELDLYTVNNIINEIELINLAGEACYNVIKNNYNYNKVLLLLGSGNNACDTIVIGNKMIEDNIKVDAYFLFDKMNKNLSIYKDGFKGNIIDSFIDEYDIIIDGIFGIGLNKKIDSNIKDIIDNVNNFNSKIISIDIPSGINGYNGYNMGSYIKCDLCISIKYHKSGIFLLDGATSYKNLCLVDIPIIDTNDFYDIINPNNINLENRSSNSSKKDFKRCSIIAGSYKYSGASLISINALNSFRMGVGYSRLYIIKSLYNEYILKHPEIIVSSLDEINGLIKYNEKDLDDIIKNSDSISIGMGMDISKDLFLSIKYLLNNYNKTLIIDADGLNSLSKYGIDILKEKKCNVIVTPHIKEFSRMLNVSCEDILFDPFKYVLEFSNKYDVCVLLKNASSIICYKNKITINNLQCSGLAKGGSGDLLSGILTGICAYNDDIYQNTIKASYILSKSAILCSKDYACEFMTPSKVSEYINNCLIELHEKK